MVLSWICLVMSLPETFYISLIVMCLCIEKNINLINLMKETLFPFFYQCNFTKTVKGEDVMVTPLMVYDRVLDFPFELSLIQLWDRERISTSCTRGHRALFCVPLHWKASFRGCIGYGPPSCKLPSNFRFKKRKKETSQRWQLHTFPNLDVFFLFQLES